MRFPAGRDFFIRSLRLLTEMDRKEEGSRHHHTAEKKITQGYTISVGKSCYGYNIGLVTSKVLQDWLLVGSTRKIVSKHMWVISQ